MNIKSKALKWILGVAATVVLGALGSGLWQNILGPALHFVTRWILDLASLGFASYKNSVYQQIAADNQYEVALLTLVATIFTFTMVGFINMSRVSRRINKRLSATLGTLKRMSEEPPVGQSVDIRRRNLERRRTALQKFRSVHSVLLSVTAVVFVVLCTSLARASYVSSAEAHYHRVMRIVSPYLPSGEQAQADSDFSQIRNREDYVKLLSKLESQCKSHGLTVPEFDPW